jgi:hypothetical protein
VRDWPDVQSTTTDARTAPSRLNKAPNFLQNSDEFKIPKDSTGAADTKRRTLSFPGKGRVADSTKQEARMIAQLSRGSLALLLIAGWSVACSEAAQKGGNQKTPAANTKATDEDDDEDDGDEPSDEGDGDEASGDGDVDKVFALFCERAAETKAAKDKLGDYLEKFCTGGKPTDVLSSKLIDEAYTGSGEPKLKKMGEWVDDPDEKTTEGFFGTAIKLPISIEDHFNKVGPKAGDEANIKRLAETSGSIVEIAKIAEEHKEDGKYHVRGWTIEQKLTKELAAIKLSVTAHTIARSDQHELEKGSAYLYTQYLVESKQTIKTFDTLTAGISVGGSSYLLTVARVKLENMGFPPIAKDTIKETASQLVKTMYKEAEAAQ